jgi:hypothetical protein
MPSKGLVVVDISSPDKPKTIQIYNSATTMGRITLLKKAVLVAGNKKMATTQLFPEHNYNVSNEKAIRLGVPAGMRLGHYDVIVKGSGDIVEIMHDAIEVKLGGAGKNPMNMEKFQQLFKKYQADEASK